MLFLDYLRHLARAGDEHSLHSPFLFEFYNAVVKGKNQPQTNKTPLYIKTPAIRRQQFYSRVINQHFLHSRIAVLGKFPKSLNQISGIEPISVQGPSRFLEDIDPIDFLIINLPLTEELFENLQTQFFSKLHEESMVLIENIYASNTSKACWEKLKASNEVQQSLDFYQFGMLLFREKQPRQHFRLQL